jgi:predicted ester cyclase
MSTPEENKAMLQRFYDEGWNANNLDVYDEMVAESFHEWPGVPGLEGREGFRQLNVMFRAAMPDIWVTVDRLAAEGDRVACRWTSTGTHQGELFGIGPTGKQATVTGTSITRVSGGMIAEDWTNWDTLGLLQQLGAVPAPATA